VVEEMVLEEVEAKVDLMEGEFIVKCVENLDI